MHPLCYHILALASCAISCTATDPSSTSSQHIDISRSHSYDASERSDDTKERQYIIVPNNAMDNDTNWKTEEFLEAVTQQRSIFSAKDSSNGLIWWLANVTDLEVYTIRENPGIAAIEEDTLDTPEAAVLLPSTPSKLPVPNNVVKES